MTNDGRQVLSAIPNAPESLPVEVVAVELVQAGILDDQQIGSRPDDDIAANLTGRATDIRPTVELRILGQVDHVVVAFEIDDAIASAVPDKDISAFAAGHGVIPRTAIQGVVACTSADGVICCALRHYRRRPVATG